MGVMEITPAENPERQQVAKLGNCNGLSTGRGIPRGFDLGRIPRRFKRIQADVYAMRDYLEDAYLKNGGALGPWALGQLQEAAREELRARLLMTTFTGNLDKLSPTEKVALLKDVSAATRGRNRCLKELGLHAPEGSVPENLLEAIKQAEG